MAQIKILFLICFCLFSTIQAKYQAVSYLSGSGVEGFINIEQESPGSVVIITGNVTGLTPNQKHGFHIHQKGDILNKCMSAAGHFNPYNKNHGAPQDEDRHAGDLGNIQVDSNGVANINIVDSILSLCPSSDTYIVGRAIVVHSGEDDLGLGGFEDSKTTGHAGSRVACGVIGIV